jgi:hypothetical protein
MDPQVIDQNAYDPQAIESEAQSYWQQQASCLATEDPDREKFYCLAMFKTIAHQPNGPTRILLI